MNSSVSDERELEQSLSHFRRPCPGESTLQIHPGGEQSLDDVIVQVVCDSFAFGKDGELPRILPAGREHEGYRGVRGADESHYNLVARNSAPILDVELADFGARIYTVRKLENERQYLRVTCFVMPNLSAFPGQTGGEGY